MQIKSLLTGLTLTAELKSDESDIRHFITVDCYEYDEFNNVKEMSKFLKPVSKINKVYFIIREFKVNKKFIDMGLYVGDDELLEDKCLKDIYGLEELNNELLKVMDDLSLLVLDHNTENPLYNIFISDYMEYKE